MSRVTRAVAVAGATLAVVLAAGCGGSTPSAASSPAAPTAEPAGTYTSTAFQPPVTYTLPEGWRTASDQSLFFALTPADNDLIGVYLFRDPKAASQDPTCPAQPEPNVGGTSSDLLAWIAARPGLTVSPPALVSVGNLRGVSIDISLKADWTAACPFADGSPSVSLFNSPGIDHWVVVGSERLRAYLLDLPGGGLLVVDIDAFDGAQLEDLLGRSSSIVRSMQFDVSGGGGSAAPSQ